MARHGAEHPTKFPITVKIETVFKRAHVATITNPDVDRALEAEVAARLPALLEAAQARLEAGVKAAREEAVSAVAHLVGGG